MQMQLAVKGMFEQANSRKGKSCGKQIFTSLKITKEVISGDDFIMIKPATSALLYDQQQ